MKTLQKIAFTLCLTLVFAACGSSGGSSGGDAYLTAKVDGTAFTALSSVVGAAGQNGVMTIQGSNSSGEAINFAIPAYNGAGTYSTASGTLATIQYITVTPVVSYSASAIIGTGTVTVTEDDDSTITGTFSFTGYKDANTRKAVTEGKFSAPRR